MQSIVQVNTSYCQSLMTVTVVIVIARPDIVLVEWTSFNNVRFFHMQSTPNRNQNKYRIVGMNRSKISL